MEDIIPIVLLSTTKTCNLEQMPTNMLKDNIDLLAPILTNIVTASLQSGFVPQNTKRTLVTPSLNKICLDVNVLTNYRPIARARAETVVSRQQTSAEQGLN